MYAFIETVQHFTCRILEFVHRLIRSIFSKSKITVGYSVDSNKFMSYWIIHDKEVGGFNLTGTLTRLHNKPNIKHSCFRRSYEI